MTLTNERWIRAHKYIDLLRKENKELSTDVIFGRRLINMDELSQAESYLNRMLSMIVENPLEYAAFLFELGSLSLRKYGYRKAEEVFNHAYTIRKNLLPENHLLIAR